MSTPLFLANNFIYKALQDKYQLSPMKLQKLIYFTYRDYIQETGAKLFNEPISAWKYGPVVEGVYSHFKSFGAESIDKFYKNATGQVLTIEEQGTIGKIINTNWAKYRDASGVHLSMMTHQSDSAWDKAVKRKVAFLDDEDIKTDNTGQTR